jgi:hypothetical protein
MFAYLLVFSNDKADAKQQTSENLPPTVELVTPSLVNPEALSEGPQDLFPGGTTMRSFLLWRQL